MDQIKILYVTCKDKNEARFIGKSLIEERLAACVNVYPEMESLYRWQDRIETSIECVLMVKTQSALVSECIEKIKSLHSYTVPCILCLGVDAGTKDYMEWLLEATRS
jgi:periplasmic divalent cation tolerance protein